MEQENKNGNPAPEVGKQNGNPAPEAGKKKDPKKKDKGKGKGQRGSIKLFTHYNASNLVNINLADKQNVSYWGIAGLEQDPGDDENTNGYFVAMPAFAAVTLQLTTPSGDNRGWRSGIKRIWQQLYTANSGRINFTQTDIEKYVQNVRALTAVFEMLAKTYEWSYTFRSTNDDYPQAIIESMRMNYNSITSNAANLLMYVQRYAEEIRQNFPLNIPYLKWTSRIFRNNFADSNTEKPSVYITTLQPRTDTGGRNNGVIYWLSSPGTNTGNAGYTWTMHQTWDQDSDGMTYEELISAADAIKNELLDDVVMSFIAQAMIKAYGDKAYYNYEAPDIKSQAKICYDPLILKVIQNANVLAFRNTNGYYWNGMNTQSRGETQVDYSESLGSTLKWINSSLRFVLSLVQQGNTGIDGNVSQAIVNRMNDYLLNWDKDSITPEEILTITRWVPTQATSNNAGEEAAVILDFATFGTEIVTDVFACYRRSSSNIYIDAEQTTLIVAPIAGYVKGDWNIDALGSTPRYTAAKIGRIMMLWANFDYAPRIQFMDGVDANNNTTDIGETSSISPAILDWDVYGELNGVKMAQYFSYGDQSLLYAGESQNQSNRLVYGKQNGKPIKSDKKADSNHPTGSDVS